MSTITTHRTYDGIAVYSAVWCLQDAVNNLHAAACCAREQQLVKEFWANDAPRVWSRRGQLERCCAKEKRAAAKKALARMVQAVVLLNLGVFIR